MNSKTSNFDRFNASIEDMEKGIEKLISECTAEDYAFYDYDKEVVRTLKTLDEAKKKIRESLNNKKSEFGIHPIPNSNRDFKIRIKKEAKRKKMLETKRNMEMKRKESENQFLNQLVKKNGGIENLLKSQKKDDF